MRKQTKKIVSLVLSAAMALTLGAGVDMTKAAAEDAAVAIPTEADLVGTAQLDSQANGWCGNEDCVNLKADINGAGTYVVSSTWEEVQDDYQAYCALRIPELDGIAAYVDFKDVTVWVNGYVTDFNLIRGGDKDCRIQLWNTWGEHDLPEDLPAEFYEIKVQFTIGVRATELDWEVEAKDPASVVVDNTPDNYKPETIPADFTGDVPFAEDVAPATNAVSAIKAAKKSVTVKKGKTAKLTFKVTAADSKTATTDKVTVKSSNKKVAKVVGKAKVSAGKIVVSVKGAKKGSAKITVKAGKKTATVKVKVK